MKTQLFCILSFIAATTVHATKLDKFELVGKDVQTAVSGYGGAWKVIGIDGHYQGLHTIVWGEKTDDPCGMYVVTAHLNDHSAIMLQRDLPAKNEASKYVYGDFKIVADTHRPYFEDLELRHVEEVKLDCNGDKKAVSAIANDKYVYKIQVCTTDKRKTVDNKLKGIKIWTRTLVYRNYKPDGNPILIDEPAPQEAKHNHCKKWHRSVQCDAGEVAQRLVVHHNEIGHRDWATGLAMFCKKVRLKVPPSKREVLDSPTEIAPNRDLNKL